MKRMKYLVFLVGLCFVGFGSVSAASFKVSTNKTMVVVGNTVNVTVSVNGNDAAGWEYCLSYDTSVFTLTNPSNNCVLGGTLAGNKSVTFTLKAKKSGSTTFSLRDASILDDSANSVLTTTGSVSVRAKTQAEIEASYSTNANLSGLRVVDYEITPDFNKDVLEYNLEVENEIEQVTIRATKADGSASVDGTGDKTLTEGLNRFEIVVTAEKGNKKTYVINVTRKELDPIRVEVDGFEYTIVRKAEAIEVPTYYSAIEVEIQGEMVPALNSDITGYTLIGLKDEAGNIELYRYLEDKNEYTLYKQVDVLGVVFIPLNAENLLEKYDQIKNVVINDVNVKAYHDGENSDYVLVYGMNAATGKKSWFTYDTVDNTLQRYVVPKEKEVSDIYVLLTVVFATLSGLSILLVIILIATNSKVRKKNQKLVTMLQAVRDASKQEKETKIVEDKEDDVEAQLEKNKKEKEVQDKLRAQQEEFLDTAENEIVEDDVELEEEQQDKKKKRGRKKKEG